MAFVPVKPVSLGTPRTGEPQRQNGTPPHPNRNQTEAPVWGEAGTAMAVRGAWKFVAQIQDSCAVAAVGNRNRSSDPGGSRQELEQHPAVAVSV
jgi:hypothetical protein